MGVVSKGQGRQMRRKMCEKVALLAALLVMGSVVLGRAEEFARYCNGRFGFCVEYPARLVLEPEPDNGDGRRFHDNAGFLMIASGINNATGDTLESETRSQAVDFDRITYRARGRDWFVLSGNKGSHILYRKTFIGPGAVNHLFFEYPAALNRTYNPVVTRISRSFQPGDLGSPR